MVDGIEFIGSQAKGFGLVKRDDKQFDTIEANVGLAARVVMEG